MSRKKKYSVRNGDMVEIKPGKHFILLKDLIATEGWITYDSLNESRTRVYFSNKYGVEVSRANVYKSIDVYSIILLDEKGEVNGMLSTIPLISLFPDDVDHWLMKAQELPER